MAGSEYEFWLFDLDGTLVDVEWSYARGVLDEVGDRLGVEFSDREAEVLWHGLGGSRDAQLAAWGYDADAFWTALDDVEDPVARAEATYLHEDAAALADLDRPTGLVTHCAAFLAEPVLDHLDIADWFDTRLCCSPETGYKPDARPLELAMTDLGVTSRERGVYVGDGQSDVEAAANAGLHGVHVERHDPEVRGRCVLGDRRTRRVDTLLQDAAE